MDTTQPQTDRRTSSALFARLGRWSRPWLRWCRCHHSPSVCASPAGPLPVFGWCVCGDETDERSLTRKRFMCACVNRGSADERPHGMRMRGVVCVRASGMLLLPCTAIPSKPKEVNSRQHHGSTKDSHRTQQAGRGCIDQLPACSLQRQPKRGAVRHAPPPWQPASCPPTDKHVFVPSQVATAAKEERGAHHTPCRDRSKTTPAAPRNRNTSLCVLGCEVEHVGWCQRARSTQSVARGALKY